MASGPEMMMKSLLKALGVNAEEVMGQVNKIGSTIAHVGSMMTAILRECLTANRRLARIEEHLGLHSEPLTVMVIEHDTSQHDDGVGRPVLPGDAGAR